MKGFALFTIVMLALVMFAGTVAAGPDFVSINSVEVNDQVASAASPIRLERGEAVIVEVSFTGNPAGKCTFGDSNPCYDVRAEAELEGYEYGDIRDVDGPFEVEPGVSDKVFLRFSIPEDMAVNDDITLNIELKDDDDVVVARFPVRLQEVRHSLNVFDVIFNPGDNVQAGQPLFTTVRLENLGDNAESSVKVTVAVPALGVQTSEFVDQLATGADEEGDDEADDAATTDDLLLMIPENAQEGDYSVVVMLEYNRGRSVAQKTFQMHVRGAAQTPATQVGQATVVNVDSQAQRVEEGVGAVFKFSVGNLGQQAASYTFEVVGADGWSNVRVDPTTLVVQPNSAGEAVVYVAPKEDVEGIKTFTVRVKSGNTLVAEKNLSVEVVEGGVDAKTVLTWIFVVLLVVLVVLAVVVLVRRRSSDSVEGQTYY